MNDPRARLGAVLLLACLLRARAARFCGEGGRATAWAMLGVLAALWWPGWRPMLWALETQETKSGNG